MKTKIKIPLVALFLIPVAYLCAQDSYNYPALNLNQPESLVTYRTTYSYGEAGGAPMIQVEKQLHTSAYSASQSGHTGIVVQNCEAPIALNLEDVACLVSDAAREQSRQLSGDAEIQILLDKQGKYLSHRIMSMEYTPLVAAVERQIDQIQFTPARVNQSTSECWVNVKFRFSQ